MTSRNAKVLALILRSARTALSVTRLQKLAYMADLLAWQILGQPISGFKYIRHHYGPFDADLYRAIEELFEAGSAKAKECTTWARNDCMLVQATHSSSLQLSDFTPGELHLIHHVVTKFERMKLDQFLKKVYETPPMRNAKSGEALPMEQERLKESEALWGISLEQILESRREFAEGKSVPLEQFLEELRT